VHQLFLGLAHVYPEIKSEALRRLKKFALKEDNRTKSACPSIGDILPLMMVVDEKSFSWCNICTPCLMESFDRAVLWICKAHPKLERICGHNGKPESDTETEERLVLSREAMAVSMRLLMFHVYFLRTCCRGTTKDRAKAYELFFGRPDEEDVLEKEISTVTIEPSNVSPGSTKEEPTKYNGLTLSFFQFNEHVVKILNVSTWQQFFHHVSARCPPSKPAMAQLLRQAVRNSRRKRYHTAGMNFSLIQANGTSAILSKGQAYSASSGLRRVSFHDDWTFDGGTKFLDATCLVYRGKHLLDIIDYQNTTFDQAIVHSGDVMRDDGGNHTIQIDLGALRSDVTSLVFVLSAFMNAKLSDILSASISFRDSDASADDAPLCCYDLSSHDKVDHLTSVIMCKLYRKQPNTGWHILAIGDAHRGDANNYEPIKNAVRHLL
jgi:stress response protein SCP2